MFMRLDSRETSQPNFLTSGTTTLLFRLLSFQATTLMFWLYQVLEIALPTQPDEHASFPRFLTKKMRREVPMFLEMHRGCQHITQFFNILSSFVSDLAIF